MHASICFLLIGFHLATGAGASGIPDAGTVTGSIAGDGAETIANTQPCAWLPVSCSVAVPNPDLGGGASAGAETIANIDALAWLSCSDAASGIIVCDSANYC